MAYTSVNDYITEAQALTQDVGAIRYSQTRYVQALNAGLGEGYRVRPDFFRGLDAPPVYDPGNVSEEVNWPKQYALPLVLYIVGHIALTDAQGNEDARGAAFTSTFINKLTKAGV